DVADGTAPAAASAPATTTAAPAAPVGPAPSADGAAASAPAATTAPADAAPGAGTAAVASGTASRASAPAVAAGGRHGAGPARTAAEPAPAPTDAPGTTTTTSTTTATTAPDAGTTATGPDTSGSSTGDAPRDGSSQPGAPAGPVATPAPDTSATAPAPAPTGVGPPAAAAPTAPTAPVPVATPVARPAMAQVVPEVTRLVSRGDGVHRLTMKLQPEALGEVRVTLTMRDGAVQVQLTGGEHAARALAEGAPELRRVLELVGAADARVVVRDLAGQSTATAGHQPGQHGGHHPGQQPGTTDQPYGAQGAGGDASAPGRDGGQQDQHARTRGGATARDGLTDGASTLRPDPVRGAPRGVDLTM
ncbi:flagellar hook-length control protein FliK, partial [Nocardioides zeicaulis]